LSPARQHKEIIVELSAISARRIALNSSMIMTLRGLSRWPARIVAIMAGAVVVAVVVAVGSV
jgi:hypothetical protein